MINKILNKLKENKESYDKLSKTVCRCYDVNRWDIEEAINNGCMNINEVRKNTKAGTACGKCNATVEYEVLKAKKSILNKNSKNYKKKTD